MHVVNGTIYVPGAHEKKAFAAINVREKILFRPMPRYTIMFFFIFLVSRLLFSLCVIGSRNDAYFPLLYTLTALSFFFCARENLQLQVSLSFSLAENRLHFYIYKHKGGSFSFYSFGRVHRHTNTHQASQFSSEKK